MKRAMIFLAVTLLSVTTAQAETWECTYKHGGKTHDLILKRVSGGFAYVYENGQVSSPSTIIKETREFVHLYSNYGDPEAFITVMDKHKQMFSMVSFKIGFQSDFIEGPCKIYGK